MKRITLLIFAGVVITLFLLTVSKNARADSFPFRSVEPGTELPTVNLGVSGSNTPFTLNSTNGKKSAILFWSADNPSKKKRAIKTLKTLKGLGEFLHSRDIALYVVNIGNDTPDQVSEVMSTSSLEATVYTDPDKSAYGGFGIYVMPAIMLVDDQGKISSGLGYSRDLKKRLKGEIEVMLGEKDHNQLDQELRPETIEKSVEEKNAKRHFHLGETMMQRGQPEAAVKEFLKALELESGMTEAHIKLGCLYLDLDNITPAKEHLEKGLEANPDSVEGQICQARVKAGEGDLDAGIDDLRFLLLRNARNHSLHFALATMLEKKKMFQEAVKEYRISYELIRKREMHK